MLVAAVAAHPVANRNYFQTQFSEMRALAKQEEKNIFLMALDLDNFKPVNDDYGHSAGDTVLKSVALRLVTTFRENDIVARIGGDEFVVAMYGPSSLDSVTEIVKRLLLLIKSPIPFGKDLLSVGISIGILSTPPEDDSPLEILMQQADAALYKAKDNGKNTYHVIELTNEKQTLHKLSEAKVVPY